MDNSQQAREGLDFIVEHPEYVKKLAAALDATGPGAMAIKKQMFELLAALCAHCEEGRTRVLETLEHHKKLKNERHRLTFIVQEIDRATLIDYQTSLVAFINCLIISTPRLIDRIRLRNEFIGCHLLPVLNNLRKYAEAEPELAVQLDVFDEQRESDEHQCLEGPHGVDLNSPLDVFYAILNQVTETPQETHFMSILQHLLRIDPKEPISDVIWETAEKLVHRASLLDKREDAPKILRTPSTTRLFAQCQSCQHRTEPSGSGSRRSSLTITNPLSPTRQTTPPPPPMAPNLPPPPPPPPNIPAPPPPMVPMAPPPPMSSSSNGKHMVYKVNSGESSDSDALEKLPQQEIPAPKIKMKTINWNKIPNNKVIGQNNIWTQVASRHQKSPLTDLDWSEMEGLFCQSSPSVQSSPRLGGGEDGRKLRHDNQEITLLDGKRSLNVNIFLKQFRSSNENIIHLVRDGLHDEIGTEKLKGLLKMLPEVDELDMLKSFKGDFNKLGNAEKFLIQLTDLSNYKLRIESMLLKEEFASNMNYLEPSISSMIAAAQDLMTNKPLQEVLYMILCAGNFLNAGGYAGDAAGVKLSSLQKITDIRANKPNMNLIHFVALQAEKRDRNLLSFTDNINVLEEAAKMTVEQLLNEINALDLRLKKIKRQIELPTTEPEIREQMYDFLIMAENEVSNLQIQLNNLERVRRKLSDFFCEDPSSFKIEECFKIFHGFYTKFKQAAAENERRRIQEEQANARRKQREELLATRRKQMESLGQPDSDGFIEMQIYDAKSCQPNKKVFKNQVKNGSEDEISIASSPSLSRRRLGSFNGNSNADSSSREDRSPDITPNGSLRRRRSRVLSEEDEGNLMDFLKASGTDTNRDRKSWGSLDRSWARKARGSGPRKRPALLTADFSSDRERPSSPSPLNESKPIVSSAPENTPEILSKPKEWAQKIESWLRTNDSDNQNDEKRQGRKIGTKKNLEDSESERSNTLDTLPEGKQVYSGSQSNYRKVNPTWRPSSTLDNTDIMSAMETVEEVQPPPVKDKSAWRKSTLNVANSSEPTLPRSSRSDLTTLEDPNDRKHLISSLGDKSASDRLTLYFRKPGEPKEGKDAVSPTPPRLSSFGYATSKSRDSPVNPEPPLNNKAEIDQDNIETPPATRKMFVPTPVDKREPVPPTPCKRHGRSNGHNGTNGTNETKDLDDNDAGDGQFDRFSAARRTRRYKRPTDSNDTLSPTDYRSPPQSQSVSKSPSLDFGKPNFAQSLKLQDNVSSINLNKDDLLQANEIQRDFEPVNRIDSSYNRMENKIEDNSNIKLDNSYNRIGQKIENTASKMDGRIDKRSRNKTVDIGRDEFRLARQLSQHRDSKEVIKDFISPENIKVEYNKFDPISHKHKEADKDEGFEETQSLCLSESPSQKTSSDGANYESETYEATPVQNDIILERFKRPQEQVLKTEDNKKTTSNISNRGTSARRSFVDRLSKNVQSTLSSRTPNLEPTKTKSSGASLPRRSDSMKSSSNSTYTKASLSSIQKSNSRNSILSSRSSLNSNTSVNTVKHVPIKSANISAITKTSKTVQRTPSTKKLAASSSTTAGRPTVKRSTSVTSTGSNGTSKSSTGRSSMSFMKPTTASATKVNPPGSKPAPSYRGRW